MEILALKLVTGEDILGEIESQSEIEFVLVNPVGIRSEEHTSELQSH